MNFRNMNKVDYRRKLLFLGFIIAVLLIISSYIPQAKAHTEGRMQLSAEDAGPYKLTVWTSPDPAIVGELHVALAVVMSEDASPVLDAAVIVSLSPHSGGERLSELATTEDSENKFLYEAAFDILESGLYKVDLEVVGTDGARGDASFDLEVIGESGFNILYVIPIALALGAIVLLFLAFRDRSPE